MDNEEIINGMQRIMEIAMCYCHPSIPDVDDWHAVHSIAETIYNSLKDVYELELSVLLSIRFPSLFLIGISHPNLFESICDDFLLKEILDIILQRQNVIVTISNHRNFAIEIR